MIMKMGLKIMKMETMKMIFLTVEKTTTKKKKKKKKKKKVMQLEI